MVLFFAILNFCSKFFELITNSNCVIFSEWSEFNSRQTYSFVRCHRGTITLKSGITYYNTKYIALVISFYTAVSYNQVPRRSAGLDCRYCHPRCRQIDSCKTLLPSAQVWPYTFKNIKANSPLLALFVIHIFGENTLIAGIDCLTEKILMLVRF